MNLPKDLDKVIVLYLYGELSEDERREFETHLQYNEESRIKLEQVRVFHKTLDNRITLAPSDAGLEAARLKLRERLREERRESLRENWLQRSWSYLRLETRLGIQLGALALVLILGVLVGRWSAEESPTASSRMAAIEQRQMPPISDIDLVEYDPDSRSVTVHYKTVDEVSLSGSVEDPEIRRALTYAIRSEPNPGRRLEAVKATAGQPFADQELEEALIKAMHDDDVDGVRLRAAKVLKSLPTNESIKNAFIRVLLKDENPAMRMEALNALSQAQGQGQDVAPILRNAAEDDDNEFVRLQASRTLERTENPKPSQE